MPLPQPDADGRCRARPRRRQRITAGAGCRHRRPCASRRWGSRPADHLGRGLRRQLQRRPLVLHHGRIVHERYAGCLDRDTLHGAMSLTKSSQACWARCCGRGRAGRTRPVRALILELKSSAFGDATVRQVLDITTAPASSRTTPTRRSKSGRIAQAGSPLPPPAGYTGPQLPRVAQQINKSGAGTDRPSATRDAQLRRPAGCARHRKAAGEPLAECIWRRIGAEREAFYTVDTIGTLCRRRLQRSVARPGAPGPALKAGRRMERRTGAAYRRDRAHPARRRPRLFAPGRLRPAARLSASRHWWHSGDAHGVFSPRRNGQTPWDRPGADT